MSAAVARLDPDDRMLLALRYGLGFNATELAATLGLSKPTISHHVFMMREACLIEEHVAGGKSVELSLTRATVEGLSGALIERLFG